MAKERKNAVKKLASKVQPYQQLLY